MGMYTELHFNVELKKDVPANVIDVLKDMLGVSDTHFVSPDHEFFKTTRWKTMFHSDSYYFNSDTHCTLRFDEVGESYYLCLRFNVKNYDGEIQKFISWIMPYLHALDGDFLGFHRYENNLEPTLIYYKPQPVKKALLDNMVTYPEDTEKKINDFKPQGGVRLDDVGEIGFPEAKEKFKPEWKKACYEMPDLNCANDMGENLEHVKQVFIWLPGMAHPSMSNWAYVKSKVFWWAYMSVTFQNKIIDFSDVATPEESDPEKWERMSEDAG